MKTLAVGIGPFLLVLLTASAGVAQTTDNVSAVSLAERIDGPPAPLAPAVVTRDELGNATVRAVRVSTPIRVDGRLDDAVWRDIEPITDFVQREPNEGARPSDPIEVRFAYDDDVLYVGARMYSDVPIQAPLADYAGVDRAMVVTAFQSASGVVNLITPTSAVVMGGLALAKVRRSAAYDAEFEVEDEAPPAPPVRHPGGSARSGWQSHSRPR